MGRWSSGVGVPGEILCRLEFGHVMDHQRGSSSVALMIVADNFSFSEEWIIIIIIRGGGGLDVKREGRIYAILLNRVNEDGWHR